MQAAMPYLSCGTGHKDLYFDIYARAHIVPNREKMPYIVFLGGPETLRTKTSLILLSQCCQNMNKYFEICDVLFGGFSVNVKVKTITLMFFATTKPIMLKNCSTVCRIYLSV